MAAAECRGPRPRRILLAIVGGCGWGRGLLVVIGGGCRGIKIDGGAETVGRRGVLAVGTEGGRFGSGCGRGSLVARGIVAIGSSSNSRSGSGGWGRGLVLRCRRCCGRWGGGAAARFNNVDVSGTGQAKVLAVHSCLNYLNNFALGYIACRRWWVGGLRED